MNSIKNKLALLCIMIFISMNVYGQHQHEFSIWGAGGLSTIKYKTTFGEQKNGFGGNTGLGYTYFFSEHLGIHTGVELGLYNAQIKINNLTDAYKTVDYIEKQPIEYRTRLDNYEERQKTWNINIPFMLQYQSKGRHKFFAALGGKISFPMSSTYTSGDDTELHTSGYYYETTLQELHNPHFAGYGDFSGSTMKGDLDLKIAYMGSIEAGIKWKLSNNWALYTGGYFDYGFNNIRKNNPDKNFIIFDNTLQNNGVLDSKYTYNGKTESFTDKIQLMSVGIKMRLAFGRKPLL